MSLARMAETIRENLRKKGFTFTEDERRLNGFLAPVGAEFLKRQADATAALAAHVGKTKPKYK